MYFVTRSSGFGMVCMILLGGVLAGCATVSPQVDYPVSPRMATTWVAGQATISWNSISGEVYTIFYTDVPRGQRPNWRPLPQAERVRGNGRQMVVEDNPPAGIERRYLLLSGDQQP